MTFSACANRTILHATPSLLANAGALAHSLPQLCNAIYRVADKAQLALISRNPGAKTLTPIVNDVQLLPVAPRQRFDSVMQSFQPKAPLSLIHQHGIWQQSMREVSAFARSKRIPLVLSPHGMLSPTLLRHHPLQKKIDLFLYQRRDLKNAVALHATTQNEVAQIRAQKLRQPILLIPNGIPLPPIEMVATHEEGKKERTALCMARMHQPHELESLLQIWAKLKPQGWRLHIAGSDDTALQAQLQRQAVELRIDNRVGISGVLFGIAHQHAYHSADLFILPSVGEAFDSVAIEALAYGLPLISRVGTFSDEPERMGCGWHTATRDGMADALAQAIALDNAERTAMGKKARALVESKYHWPQIGRNMLRCYSWLLGETSTRPDCVVTD